jgi:precorrin-6B methylase 2
VKQKEIAKANNSCKSANYRAVTPKYIIASSSKNENILDFGAGIKACHTQQMSKMGFNVTAYDFGENVTDKHDINALNTKYDTVFASNVLNIQSSKKMLIKTLEQMWNAVKQNGRLVVNYPSSPRYINMTTKEMNDFLKMTFNHVTRIKFKKYNLIWEIKRR